VVACSSVIPAGSEASTRASWLGLRVSFVETALGADTTGVVETVTVLAPVPGDVLVAGDVLVPVPAAAVLDAVFPAPVAFPLACAPAPTPEPVVLVAAPPAAAVLPAPCEVDCPPPVGALEIAAFGAWACPFGVPELPERP
jgi:hypothetical protein